MHARNPHSEFAEAPGQRSEHRASPGPHTEHGEVPGPGSEHGERLGRPEVETREIAVDDPTLSASANQRLTDEVREVIGSDRATVPRDRPRTSRGRRPHATRDRLGEGVRPANFALVMIGASSIVIGAIIALLFGQWWILPLAVIVLCAVTAAIVGAVFRMTSIRERPSPATAAALEEEGVADPERRFSELVDEYTPDRGAKDRRLRTTSVEDDAPRAAAEQESAITPSGGPTQPRGPGNDG